MLQQIQRDFVKAVLNPTDVTLVNQVRKNQITPEFRVQVHRNNILQNLTRALEITFPSVWALVGKEYGDHLAHLFCHEEVNLPVSSNLDDWGAKFPDFLVTVDSIRHLIYLPDIARLDWLKHRSFRAESFNILNPLALQKKLKYPEALYLSFNPSVYLFSSGYLLEELLELIEGPNEVQTVHLKTGPCYAIIFRQSHYVKLHWISQDMFRFFNAIQSHLSLRQAYEVIYSFNPEFELTAVIQFMLKKQLLLSF